MIPVPEFDHVSVISDLHMGGPSNFQIFGQASLLAAFIDDLIQQPASNSALVINGDMVDFLAENPAMYLDPAGAITKLDRIAADPAFKPVFDALTRYTNASGRTLAITLGNHDLELALPWVKERFLNLLSGGNPAAKSRIVCSFDGAGFACRAGNSSVLCLHGNEVDAWNLTDYEQIRRVSNDYTQGRQTKEWTPNAGTKLVIDVMNRIKHDLPFIDLLKPETEAALRLLFILRPDQREQLGAATAVVARRAWDEVRHRFGFLSTEDETESGAVDPLISLLKAPHSPINSDELLDRAEARFRTHENPLDMVAPGENGKLGWWDATLALVRHRPEQEVAFEAVKELAGDTTFDLSRVDPDFTRLDALAGPPVDFLIAGHTHLARSFPRACGAGQYFNSGTWASLMNLPKKALTSAASFQPFFDDLKRARTIAELGALVIQRPTVVTIRTDGAKTTGALNLVTKQGKKIVLGDPKL